MNFEKEREFIKETQNGILLKEYTITDMMWFMKNYKDREIEKSIDSNPLSSSENPREDLMYYLKCLPDNIKYMQTDTGEIVRSRSIDEIISYLKN